MDLNEIFVRSIYILCERVVYNEMLVHVLTEMMDLIIMLVRNNQLLWEFLEYIATSVISLR